MVDTFPHSKKSYNSKDKQKICHKLDRFSFESRVGGNDSAKIVDSFHVLSIGTFGA